MRTPIKAHLRYAWYVVRHKWFVLYAGLGLHAPLWRLLIHDYTKFSRAEWSPYVRNFFVKERAQKPAPEFYTAWHHHLAHNPHHWDHWQGEQMPESFVREMVADWMGAGRAITGAWDIQEWYTKNEAKMILHPATRSLVATLLEERKCDTARSVE